MQQFEHENYYSPSDGNDHGDERRRARRGDRCAIHKSSDSDGNDRRNADERRNRDLHLSGIDGQHIRWRSDYGNGDDQFERCGHIASVHSGHGGRHLYDNGLGSRSDRDGQLQPHE